MARRRGGSAPRRRTSLPKVQKATPVSPTNTAPAAAPNAKPSMGSAFLGALQNMGFYMMVNNIYYFVNFNKGIFSWKITR